MTDTFLGPPRRARRARMTEDTTDEALLADYTRSRKKEALDLLIARHWPAAFRLALGALGDRAAAEDAAQEAFVAMIRGAHRFEHGKPFGPWFRTCVLNA